MRKLRFISCAIITLSVLGTSVCSQSAQDCSALMKFGVYDKFRTFRTESQCQQIREFFENNTFSSRQQAEQKAGELGLAIDGVLNLNLGGSTSSNNFEEWRQSQLGVPPRDPQLWYHGHQHAYLTPQLTINLHCDCN